MSMASTLRAVYFLSLFYVPVLFERTSVYKSYRIDDVTSRRDRRAPPAAIASRAMRRIDSSTRELDDNDVSTRSRSTCIYEKREEKNGSRLLANASEPRPPFFARKLFQNSLSSSRCAVHTVKLETAQKSSTDHSQEIKLFFSASIAISANPRVRGCAITIRNFWVSERSCRAEQQRVLNTYRCASRSLASIVAFTSSLYISIYRTHTHTHTHTHIQTSHACVYCIQDRGDLRIPVFHNPNF
ncbi:unnamed protein product [Trichogramma brassicae]|uniref:Secreted protein n=1 Tax=Trichogramma brassicae TaxID=86971 RepID=A0A6H5IMQ1_9HYME|nr:unnamed protein product [Trichogramma brassicae]